MVAGEDGPRKLALGSPAPEPDERTAAASVQGLLAPGRKRRPRRVLLPSANRSKRDQVERRTRTPSRDHRHRGRTVGRTSANERDALARFALSRRVRFFLLAGLSRADGLGAFVYRNRHVHKLAAPRRDHRRRKGRRTASPRIDASGRERPGRKGRGRRMFADNRSHAGNDGHVKFWKHDRRDTNDHALRGIAHDGRNQKRAGRAKRTGRTRRARWLLADDCRHAGHDGHVAFRQYHGGDDHDHTLQRIAYLGRNQKRTRRRGGGNWSTR